MKKFLPMKFIREGMQILPDPWKDIKKFRADLGSEEWWNAYLNVYWTYGFKKLNSFGRRPYYRDTAIKHPQLLADLFRLADYKTYYGKLLNPGNR